MTGFWNDVRYSIRVLGRRRMFSATAILAFAAGLGATTAVFAIVNGVLLKRLPVPDPERVLFITRSGDVSIPDGRDWRSAAPSFESIALFLRGWDLDLTGAGEPERLRASVVEPDYFRVLATEPLVGRALGPSDNRPGGARVAVISESFWARRFARDPSIIGRTVVFSDHPTSIVGVMPDRFDVLGDRTDVWVPAAVETPWALEERGTNNFDAIGRIRRDASLAAAQSELKSICERLERQFPKTNRGKIVVPIPLLDFLVGGVRRGLSLLLAAVATVSLIACVNLAGLLLARAAARRPEMAVRQALGAGRRRLLRQLTIEAELLSLAGASLAVPVALVLIRVLLAIAPAELPRAANVGIDFRAVAFDFAIALAAGALCAALPIRRALAGEPGSSSRLSGRGLIGSRQRRRAFNALVATEIALAVPLLVAAQLLIKSFLELRRIPLGFDPAGALTAEVVLPESRYSKRDLQTAAFRAIVENASSIPGVSAAATVIGAPLRPSGRGIGASIEIPGRVPAPDEPPPSARVRPVLGEYFDAVRSPIQSGRALHKSDDERSEPVAVVNESFAKRYWPGLDPIGRTIRLSGWEDLKTYRVVGVAADTKPAELTAEDTRAVYVPYAQRAPGWQRFGTIVLRSKGDPSRIARSLKEAIWRVDPSLTVAEIEPLQERLAQSEAPWRFLAQILGVFGVAALLLAAQGLYGVLAYSVTLRRREIGLRVALGASSADVRARFLRDGLLPVGAGLATGLGAAVVLRNVVSGLLYGVTASHGAVYVTAGAVMLFASFAASYLPARRAARVDPMEALRSE